MIEHLDRARFDRADEQKLNADRALAAGDITGGIAALDAARELCPEDDDTWLLSAKLSLDAGDTATAFELASGALERRPVNPTGWSLLAAVLDQLGDAVGASHARARAASWSTAFRDRGGSSTKGTPKHSLPAAPAPLAIVVLRTDAHANLDATLNAVGPFEGELCVVDVAEEGTPSLEAAVRSWGETRSQPTRVGILGRVGDVATATARACRTCRAEWILILHAGETPSIGFFDSVQRAQRRPRLIAATVLVEGRRRREVRLIRNAPNLRFDGFHEADASCRLFELSATWRLRITEVDDAWIEGHAPRPTLGDTDDEPFELLWWRTRMREVPEDWVAPLQVLRRSGKPTSEELERALSTVHTLLETEYGRQRCIAEPAAAALVRAARLGQRPSDTLVDALDAIVGERAWWQSWIAERALDAGRRDEAKAAVDHVVRQLDQSLAAAPPSPAHTVGYVAPEGLSDPKALGLRVAHVAIACDDAERADACLQLVLDLEPDNVEAWLVRLGIDLALGNGDGVRLDLDGIATHCAERRDAWIGAGQLLTQRSELGELTQIWYDEALRRFPDDTELMAGRPQTVAAP